MVEAKTKRFATALALMAGVALSGCEVSQDGPEFPPASETFNALFSLSGPAPFLPWPTDLFFAGSTDGTINLAGPLAALGAPPFTALGSSLNALDGFSTSAPINTNFNQAIDGTSLSGSSVYMIEMNLDNRTKLPVGGAAAVRRVLQYGTDFTAEVSDDIDSYGKILRITPLKPLTPSSGATNIGYYVLLTDGIKDMEGRPAAPDAFYATLKSAPADCSSFGGDLTLTTLCAWTKAHLAIGDAIGVDPDTVAVSWNFTTQSVDDVFAVIAQLAQPQPILVGFTGATTAAFLPPGLPAGKADVFAGTTVLPYYLSVPATTADKAILNKPWTAMGPSPVPGIDPESRNLTRFNPVPLKTTDVTVPVLVTVPNATANNGAGCPKPETGWPVAIFQHGYPRDRMDSLLIADSLANACIIMAAIDLPLHGVTPDQANPLYDAEHERTFNVDFINNDTRAAVPDGKADPTGANFLSSNFLVTRDHLRQASADVITFTKSVANLDVTGDGVADVDPNRIHFVSLSIGGMASMAAIKFSPTMRTVSVADAGGVFTQLIFDSPRQYEPIRRLLIGLGLVENSTIYNNTWFRDVQTVIDAGDPINHVKGAQLAHPMFMSKVIGDTNVPNSAFDRLALAGGFTQISAAGLTPVAAGSGVFTAVTEGDHGSVIYPVYSVPATMELQSQTVQFAASVASPPYPAGGPFVVIDNTSIIEQVD